ncbi:SGNH/GDSL hydrolase family protein [Amycolatopsis albispora]|uniref:SGNH hydrolase-type esterase domain-containing protein n=1 Tax=Amycolatopsis albispora TaxID=1804986 RepID=A0A344L5K5_9PSEU|nr:GDSL-type esterase/lipase family protein [Amycolatopsis albispora]AXB43329.1 hypothetical protein A4R43_12845 [Amycolatopsis albispora]
MRKRIFTRKRVLVAAGLLLVAVLGTIGTAGHLAFLRSPEHTPAEACGGTTARPAVVGAGASMTQGTLGGDWVGALRGRPEFGGYEFVNAGHNGDTAADLLARLDTDVVACHPAAVLVLVGTNDARDGTPLERYRADLTAITERLRSATTARIALLSLPPLGEDLSTEINHKLSGYNTVIKETATRAGVDYVPVHERMLGLLGPESTRQPYDFSFPLALTAATRHYVLGQSWDEVARSGGRALLVDHIHLNDRGAALLTDLAANWLTTITHP